MTTERIKEIQEETAYPNSISVQQALFKVWNECEQLADDKSYQPCDGCNTSCKEWEIFFCNAQG